MATRSTELFDTLTNGRYAKTSNAIGRSVGKQSEDINPFQKRLNSIENALGTTGAALASAAYDSAERVGADQMLKRQKASLEDIYKKYGYNDANAYYDAKDNTENDIFSRYGYNANDFWDKRAAADLAGNKDEIARLEKERQDVIGRMNAEDADKINYFDNIQNELKGQASTNAKEATDRAKAYEDYRKNNYVSQKINQNNTKFLGSAINTLSTASDLLGLTNGPIANAIQGGIEGFADELEQNGGTIDFRTDDPSKFFEKGVALENWDDFDVQRALQNAAIGAVSGAASGAFNQGLSNVLSSNGGKLFKGNNFLTRGINKVADFSSNAKTLPGQIAKSVGQGAVRGAASGAVGGATGAGLSAAMNGQDIIGSALEGAKRGAGQGAIAGGIMGGANAAISRTPGVGKFLQDVNQAQQDWKNSGENFNERLTNTLNSGDSAIGNWLNRNTQSNALASIGNIGNSIADVTPTNNGLDAWDRLAQQKGYNNYNEVIEKFIEANPDVKLNPRGAAGQILTWLDQNPNTPTTAGGWLKRAGERIVEDANNRGVGMSIKDVSEEITDGTVKTNKTGVNGELVNAETTDETIRSNKTSAEGKLRNAAGLKLQKQYGTIDKPTAKATNAPETLQKISEAGFTKPADVERMSDVITGSNGEVSKLVSNLVETAKPVNTFDGETSGQTLDDYIDLAIQKRGLDGINEGKAVKSQINALMRSLPSHAEGSIDFVDSPKDVFKMTQLLDAEAANYEGRSGLNYGTTNPDKLRAAQVIKDVSTLLKDRVYETVDVNKALTPEVAQNLKAYAPNNKDWANYVDNEIMSAKSVKDLRSAQAPWVRAKKIIDNGYMNSVTYGGRNGGNSSIPITKRGLVGAVLDATVNSKPALRAQAKVLNTAADIANKVSTNTGTDTPTPTPTPTPTAQTTNTGVIETTYNPSTQIYNAIGRMEGLSNGEQARTAGYLSNAANDMNSTNGTLESLYASTSTTPATSVYNNVYGTSTQASGVPTFDSVEEERAVYFFPPTGDYWSDMLSRAMRRAKNAEDYDALGSLYEMYQDAISKNSSNKDTSNPLNWSAADRKSLLEAQNGLSQIDSLANSYNYAVGDGSNAIQGTLRQWANNISGGNLDPSADSYVKQANSIGAGIIKNLVNLGSTEYDAQRYIEYLPKLTDTKEQAAQKLQVLRDAYQNVINNLKAIYAA